MNVISLIRQYFIQSHQICDYLINEPPLRYLFFTRPTPMYLQKARVPVSQLSRFLINLKIAVTKDGNITMAWNFNKK